MPRRRSGMGGPLAKMQVCAYLHRGNVLIRFGSLHGETKQKHCFNLIMVMQKWIKVTLISAYTYMIEDSAYAKNRICDPSVIKHNACLAKFLLFSQTFFFVG